MKIGAETVGNYTCFSRFFLLKFIILFKKSRTSLKSVFFQGMSPTQFSAFLKKRRAVNNYKKKLRNKMSTVSHVSTDHEIYVNSCVRTIILSTDEI